MKTTLCVLTALTLATSATVAASYSDAVGDFTGGTAGLDITSVDVNNDASTLTFAINLAGDPTAATWYNYYIGISENLFGGVGGNINSTGGWGKNIQMSVGGMDQFVGSWGTGAQLYSWGGSAWNPLDNTGGTNPDGLSATENSSSVTISFNFAALGLSPGNSFTFDVYTSDTGADTVLDALSDSTSRSWNSNPFDTAANAKSYTLTVVPEPGALVLSGAGLFLLALWQCRGRRRSHGSSAGGSPE